MQSRFPKRNMVDRHPNEIRYIRIICCPGASKIGVPGLVNSFYDPDKNEGAAFEELIGFHGGLGGYQTQPFLLYPADWNLGPDDIIGAEQVYKVLKDKLEELQLE